MRGTFSRVHLEYVPSHRHAHVHAQTFALLQAPILLDRGKKHLLPIHGTNPEQSLERDPLSPRSHLSQLRTWRWREDRRRRCSLDEPEETTDSPSCARHGGVHCRELTGDLEVYELAGDNESPPPALLRVLSALALVLGGGLSTHCVRGFFGVPLTH